MYQQEKQRPENFILFRNKKKTKGTQPDYIGWYTDEHGKKYKIDGWENPSKDGISIFISGNIKSLEKIKAIIAKNKESIVQEDTKKEEQKEKPKDDDIDLPF